MAQTDMSLKNKVRVLIADDIQETRRSVRLMLSLNPNVMVVAIAKDGAEAIELSREHHPDIVILDINMPKFDGLEAFKEISQIYPDTGCIIITADRDTTPLGMAMSLGAQEFLLKPFSIEELNEAVNRVTAQVGKSRRKLLEADQIYQKSEVYLKQLADEYAKSKRTDILALGVFEQLAENPECELRWLRTLAMLYIVRQEWGKLKALADRLERQAQKQPK
jgi:YesN/AraC family two-component response regulator